MIPLDPLVIMRWAAGLLVLGFIWYVFDTVGDAREARGEARVITRVNAAIEKVNAEAAKAGELEDKVAAVAEASRQKALADARAIPAIGMVCPASKTQADALNRIK